MAQTGFTPLQIYSSSTTTNVPTAGNLTNSSQGAELAINIADGKLFYKDSGGVVQVIASKASVSGVLSFSAGTTGFTPSTATNGVVTLAGILNIANGGTGTTSSTGTGSVVLSIAPTFTGNVIFNSTGAITLPVGTTAQEPTGSLGMMRFNSTLVQFEGYNGSAWTQVGGGATGGGSDQVFVLNGVVVTTSYTLPTGKNAESVGPIAVNTGVSVTVPSGQRWLIL